MATFNGQVTASADSGYIYPSSLDTTEGWCGWDGSALNNAFSRFVNVTIPKGATITSAYIQYRAVSSIGLANVQTSIYMSKEANPTSPNTYAAYNAKPTTTAFANWDAPPAWVSGTWYGSLVDISSVVQEIVNQSGWVSGNAMLVLHKNRKPSGSQSTLTYNVHSQGSSYAPKLVINYTTTVFKSFAITNSNTLSIIGKKNASMNISITNSNSVVVFSKNRSSSFDITSSNSVSITEKKTAKAQAFITNDNILFTLGKKKATLTFNITNNSDIDITNGKIRVAGDTIAHSFIFKNISLSYDDGDNKERYFAVIKKNSTNKYVFLKTSANTFIFRKIVGGVTTDLVSSVQTFEKWQIFNVIITVDELNGTQMSILKNGSEVEKISSNDISVIVGTTNLYLHDENNTKQMDGFLAEVVYYPFGLFNKPRCESILNQTDAKFLAQNLISNPALSENIMQVFPNNIYEINTDKELTIGEYYNGIKLKEHIIEGNIKMKLLPNVNKLKITSGSDLTNVECKLSMHVEYAKIGESLIGTRKVGYII